MLFESPESEDILRYVYQHIAFDEMPKGVEEDKIENNGAYQNDTDYIDYGLYENVSKTISLFNEIEKAQSTQFMDTHMMHMTNIGRPLNKADIQCQNEAYKEIYDMEQNEILQLNADITMKRLKDEENLKRMHSETENKDMTGDPVMLPIYKPVVHGQHKVMFANTSTMHKDELYKTINTEEVDEVHSCYLHDGETFSYDYENDKETLAPMVEAACLDIEQANKVTFADNVYGKIKYDTRGSLTAKYETSFNKTTLEIPVVIDNGASINITPKWFYDKHRCLHVLPKTTENLPPITTGNGLIKSYFWIDLPITIQGIYMQLKTLVCGSVASHGLLLSRMSLDQMQAIQLYNKREILLRQSAFPLYSEKHIEIPAGKSYKMLARVDTGTLRFNIQGKGVAWIHTNTLGYPLQPVVTDYIASKTMITYHNNTETKQTISKGRLIGYLDLRSKDGSLAELQWLIPLGKSTNDYVFYGHTAFASALAEQFLAQETEQQKNQNKFQVRSKPIKVENYPKQGNNDPYPWLDADDKRRNLTDEELIRAKIDLTDSILNSTEKEDLLQMLTQKRDAFSLRDEIGTCPYFEVRLQLRDETPFFVRPYPIREEQKIIVQ